jgi:hypothetical protein
MLLSRNRRDFQQAPGILGEDWRQGSKNISLGGASVKKRPVGSTGFIPLPKRWVVERTNAWHGRARRNSKDMDEESYQ